MAKIFGLNGVITGRQGNNVFAIRSGKQLVRKYQPVVFNPNTDAQVAVRSRMKLLSQLSAIMATAIAIPNNGMKSARNQFSSINFPATSYAGGKADIDLTRVKLTKGVLALANLNAVRAASTTINANILGVNPDDPFADVDRVEYFAFVQLSDGTLRLAQKASSSTAEGGFPVVLRMQSNKKAIVYAYGVRFNSQVARVSYGDISVVEASDIARLISSRALLESEVSLTDTKAAVVPMQSSQAIANEHRDDEDEEEPEVRKTKKNTK